ncbi:MULTISPECIES: hypothetical protein [unclassified Pseudomonas]|uniref:hypothetical protein n=1 Tax=unclassified Pseudomonas TaxID=196821 RepID=UPI001032CA17|nr:MULTISPECIES: hypothetical protein [unclassified Pseudomonas]
MTSAPWIAPVEIERLAGALDAWMPCPYSRLALMQWLEAYLASWPSNDHRLMVNTQPAQSMLHEHYREWVEVFDEYQL